MEAEALHARFGEDQDGPWQTIDLSSDWTMQKIDVSGEENPHAAAEAWMKRDLARPVDLSRGPLFAEALLKLAPDRYYWSQHIHHIAIDGYGFSLLTRRVAQIYTALAGGSPIGDELPVRGVRIGGGCLSRLERMERDRQFWLGRLPLSGSGQPRSRAQRTSREPSLRESAELPSSVMDAWQAAAGKNEQAGLTS